MIDFIDGKIAYIHPDAVVIDVGGVGYRIFCPDPYVFGSEGAHVRIFTYQHVREDLIALYGFKFKEERELFYQLISVSGIGPKGATAIISAAKPKDIVQAIYDEDLPFLTRLPGVGKKTAQRMILDLKDKLELDVWLNDVIASGYPLEKERAVMGAQGAVSEAIEALVSLGYNEKEAERAVVQVQASAKQSRLAVDELIKKALQSFLS